jgi:L-alanine-DL-glutamate epimerase-like enolase superfamily enzyme
MATAHWASTVRDFLISETVVGRRDWMDDVIVHEEPIIQEGFLSLSNRPGLGLELNAEVVKAHLAAGERYWG